MKEDIEGCYEEVLGSEIQRLQKLLMWSEESKGQEDGEVKRWY